ncbi:2,4-dihydroxyacetophenone dioxygenase, partial [Paraburkholderia sp. SIMBA_050]
MVDKAVSEFWQNIAPIANPFTPDALPEAYIPNAASDD